MMIDKDKNLSIYTCIYFIKYNPLNCFEKKTEFRIRVYFELDTKLITYFIIVPSLATLCTNFTGSVIKQVDLLLEFIVSILSCRLGSE